MRLGVKVLYMTTHRVLHRPGKAKQKGMGDSEKLEEKGITPTPLLLGKKKEVR